MATKANIIKVYAQADSAKKVDIIIRYYPNFMGIVESYTDGLRYMIENEKAFNRQANRGELGVRVQAKGNHSDITGNSAVASVMTREALVACDFSGDVLEGVDRQEEFKQEAFTLRTMRLDFYTPDFESLVMEPLPFFLACIRSFFVNQCYEHSICQHQYNCIVFLD